MAIARVLAAALLAGVVPALVLAGCLGGPPRESTPGELAMSATWSDAEHMRVSVRNVGGSPMPLSGMDMMRLTGPNGTVPIHWSGQAPTLAPGESRVFELHAMHMPNGTMAMTLDHARMGGHMRMPAGDYVLRMGHATAVATMGG